MRAPLLHGGGGGGGGDAGAGCGAGGDTQAGLLLDCVSFLVVVLFTNTPSFELNSVSEVRPNRPARSGDPANHRGSKSILGEENFKPNASGLCVISGGRALHKH